MSGPRSGVLIWVAALSLAFNLAFVGAFAYGEYCRRRARPAPAPVALELSPAQEKAMREGRDRLERDLAPLREEMAAHCRRLSDLLAAPEPDRAALKSQTAAMADLQRRVQDLILEHHLAERASLPPRQRGCLSGLLREGLCAAGACGTGDAACAKDDQNGSHGGPLGPETP